MRITGSYTVTTTLGESVRAFVPRPLPPADPPLPSSDFFDLNRQAELALARLAGVSGLVPSVEWLLYSAIRKEALLTSQIEGTQATLTDLFDEEAGLKVSNADDVEEITNYLRAFRWVQAQLRDPQGLPISVRMLCEAHRLLLDGVRGAGKQPGEQRCGRLGEQDVGHCGVLQRHDEAGGRDAEAGGNAEAGEPHAAEHRRRGLRSLAPQHEEQQEGQEPALLRMALHITTSIEHDQQADAEQQTGERHVTCHLAAQRNRYPGAIRAADRLRNEVDHGRMQRVVQRRHIRIAPVHRQRVTRQIVRPNRKEIHLSRKLSCHQCR